ncbi:hypothetical protein Q8A67_019018 [Cirrhinus molitorella]|uniref:Transmembrane protein n=1 Tax=Cirrhinus molitorella TaxID=172907 RepID=A0AA88PDB5_9TELE|nr:hypothetical protein Q8A67_019018 [Cirrhinus molitorella]
MVLSVSSEAFPLSRLHPLPVSIRRMNPRSRRRLPPVLFCVRVVLFTRPVFLCYAAFSFLPRNPWRKLSFPLCPCGDEKLYWRESFQRCELTVCPSLSVSVSVSLPVRPPTVNLGTGRLQGNYLRSDTDERRLA